MKQTVYSEDYDTIKSWVPLLTAGRPKSGEVIACSRHPDGTEVNYGLLCRNLVQSFTELGGEVQLLSTVTGLRQQEDKSWLIAVKRDDLTDTNQTVRARFVFAGAGGGSLHILQKAGIPEIVGYGGMPVSGKFLVCQKPEIIEQNRNKVYGQADVDAPMCLFALLHVYVSILCISMSPFMWCVCVSVSVFVCFNAHVFLYSR